MGFWKRLFARRTEPSADDLVATLTRSNVASRLDAAVQLHRYPGEATVSALINALADKNPEVRGAAAESLRLLRDPRAVQPLIEVLETDTEHTPVYNAIKALGYIRTPESIAALASALDRGKGDPTALAFELGEARAVSAVEPLIRLLQNGTPFQRKQAVTALARIGDATALESLERALNDADEGVRDRVRSVTEPPVTRLWCAICGDWADGTVSQNEHRTCIVCGKANITEMDLPLRFRARNADENKLAFTSKASTGQYVKKNSWGIYEGMSVSQVNKLLAQNGFQQVSVELPSKFGADPIGYQYPCWHRRDGISVTSTFKHGKLLEFSWW